MEKILAVWEKFPNLRLAQLLVNATVHVRPDMFYLTDEQLVEMLEGYLTSTEESKRIAAQRQADDKPTLPTSNERNFPRECC